MDLVRDGVEIPSASAGSACRSARMSSAPSTRVLGRVRELPEHEIPGAEAGAEVGTDEKAKITAAQRTTGTHRRSERGAARRMVGCAPSCTKTGAR